MLPSRTGVILSFSGGASPSPTKVNGNRTPYHQRTHEILLAKAPTLGELSSKCETERALFQETLSVTQTRATSPKGRGFYYMQSSLHSAYQKSSEGKALGAIFILLRN